MQLKVENGRLDGFGALKINGANRSYRFEDAKLEYDSSDGMLTFDAPLSNCHFKVQLTGKEDEAGLGTPFEMVYKGEKTTAHVRYGTWEGIDKPFRVRFDILEEPPFYLIITREEE